MTEHNEITIGFAKRLAQEAVNLGRFASTDDEKRVSFTADTIKREALALEEHVSKEKQLVTACRELIKHIDTFGGFFLPREINRPLESIRAALNEDPQAQEKEP